MNANSDYLGTLSALLGKAIVYIEKIGGGRNSRVYKIATDLNQYFTFKEYFKSASDSRDRLKTEYSAFTILNEAGFRNIPKPITADHDKSWAIYSFLDGVKLTSKSITYRDITEIAEFIFSLQREDVRDSFNAFQDAADASFSLNQLFNDIESRIGRFKSLYPDNSILTKFYNFFNKKLVAFYTVEKARACKEYTPELTLSKRYRILSPSDFGFHNLLKTSSGHFNYFDFEYFGWDSPEKCINDFLLHPGYTISEINRKLFKKHLIRKLKEDKSLSIRVDNTYNLYGVKWCLIILNVFCNDDLQRRIFSGDTKTNTLLHMQLKKAEQLLNRIEQR